jgi:hypothetical protein
LKKGKNKCYVVKQHIALHRKTMKKKVNEQMPYHSTAHIARTSTNNQETFTKVLAMPKPNRYELQTKYDVIEHLMPTKELEKFPLSMGIETNDPSKKKKKERNGTL